MIVFKTIKFKNLLSYGNNTNQFNFEEGIFKIQAKNGMGKSSIIDAVYFALFGKAYRKIKIKQLINSKNKKGLAVVLTFTKQDDNYRIERSLKPDLFKIFKNDEIIPVSSTKRGYQQILEEDILGFNESLSNQVMFKSMTKSASFMTLEKADKRQIIENLFDIELFASINKNVKKKIDAEELMIRDTKKDIENTELLIEQELANIENMRNIQKKLQNESDILIAGYNQEIKQLEDKIVQYKKGIDIINRKKIDRDVINKTRIELQLSIDKMEDEKIEIEISIRSNNEKINFLQNTCGTCPKIASMENDSSIEINKKLLIKLETELKQHKEQKNELLDQIQKLNEIISNERFVTTSLTEAINRIEHLKKQIRIVNEKVIVIDESKLQAYYNKKASLTIKFNEKSLKKEHLLILRGLFTDEGLKPIIINKYLPSINRLLNTYLTKFNANTIFNFNTSFNEVINTRNKEDYSYYNFSEGEKKRIDLAILFTFIKFAMHKNKKSNTNLLIFDEIMSGLDIHGAASLFDILKEHTDYQNKCIITINHNSDIDDNYFNKTYEVVMENGFSKIVG